MPPRINPTDEIKPPVKITLKPNASDKEKRDYIKTAYTAYAHRHGELKGEDVWWVHIRKERDSEWETVTLIGKTPDGARIARGPGSSSGSLQKLRGPAEDINVRLNTGAVDTVIKSEGNNLKMEFIIDPELQREKVAATHELLQRRAQRLRSEGSSPAMGPIGHNKSGQNTGSQAGYTPSSGTSTGLHSKKVGKIFMTPMPGGKIAYSRRSLSRTRKSS